jgi:hypothetical protein
MGLYHPLDCVTNLKYKLLYFLARNKKNSKRKALAFNRDRYCHLAICLRLILFHYLPKLIFWTTFCWMLLCSVALCWMSSFQVLWGCVITVIFIMRSYITSTIRLCGIVLGVIMPNVIMLSVIKLSAIILNAIMFIILLNVCQYTECPLQMAFCGK